MITLDVSDLAKGTYIIMVKNADNGTVANTRFVKRMDRHTLTCKKARKTKVLRALCFISLLLQPYSIISVTFSFHHTVYLHKKYHKI